MIPYQVYKLVHFFGIFTVLVALAVTCFHAMRGGTRADNPARRGIALAHGMGMFLILLGGFGMLARLGIITAGLPSWIIAKLIIWGVLGAALALPYRVPRAARPLLWALPILGVLAAYFALYKP
jgi:hypothetical protein